MILTTCKYFDLVGNRCSRVTDGKCSDLQDCEFKYIAELKAENERLKKDKIGLHSEIKQLEQENYGLNQELLGYKKGVQASEIIELKQTLQEIKAIAERAFAVCDDDCGNANKFKKIIELTKAEEE